MKEANPSLTKREKEILTLVAKAFSNKEIAANMSISPSTVKRHVENILRKLRLKNRVAAAIHASRDQTRTREAGKPSGSYKQENT